MITKIPIAPLKIILPGEFWDSHLYMGKLYLFEVDGSVHTVEWDKLISGWDVPADVTLPMHCAFSRSNYLYGPQWSLLYQDTEVREVIQSKFKRLAAHQRQPMVADWKRFVHTTHNSPFPFPHADLTIYKSGIFSVSKSGLFSFPCAELHRKRNRNKIADKMWDCPTVSVDASYGSLALAAAQEGLFEYELPDWDVPDSRGAKRVAQQHCNDCGWMYYSIVGSSHEGGGVLLEYVSEQTWTKAAPSGVEPRDVGRTWRDTPSQQRRFEKAVEPAEVFHKQGYWWGSKDKICLAHEGLMSVARYSPWRKEPERLEVLHEISFDKWKGNPVSGAVAAFGSIIELEKAIVVVRSDNEVVTIPGEPVNWRVFNRSKQYENQLHIIYDDRLEIWSFNHDYFLNQKEKLTGSVVSNMGGRRWNR